MSAFGQDQLGPREPELETGDVPRRQPQRAEVPYSQPAGSSQPPLQRKHLYEYLRVVYKRRWAALTAFVICAALVAVKTFSTIPVYEATAQVLIDKESTNVVTFKQAIEQNQTTDDYYQTQYRMLQGRALARRTLETGKLWNHPALNPPPVAPSMGAKAVGAVTGTLASWFKRAPEGNSQTAPLPDETRRQSAIIDRFLAGLVVTPIRTSRLVNVKYTSTDPQFAADAANAHARAFIEQNLEFKFLSSKEATDWLGERMAEQRKLVDSTEQALQRYREENGAISIDGRQDIVVQKLSDLNAAVTRAKTDRIVKEGLYRQLESIESNRAGLDTFPAILANGFIQQQKAELAGLQRQLAESSEKFGDKHPEIVKLRSTVQVAQTKLDGEVAKVVQSIRNEYLAADRQERSLTEALNQQKAEALAMNRKGIEYGVLEREAASNRPDLRQPDAADQGDRYLRRAEDEQHPDRGSGGNPRGAEHRHPEESAARPARRRRHGHRSGVPVRYLDNRIKNPRNSAAPWHAVPGHDSRSFRQVAADAAHHLRRAAGASWRASRGSPICCSRQQRGRAGRTIVVTSTAPGESKTAIATNLSVCSPGASAPRAAREPTCASQKCTPFSSLPQQPGLSNVLVGEAKATDAVRRRRVRPVGPDASGICPPNPRRAGFAAVPGSRRVPVSALRLDHRRHASRDGGHGRVRDRAWRDRRPVRRRLTVDDRHAARRAVEQLRYARATLSAAF